METNVIAEIRPKAVWSPIARAPWTVHLAALAVLIVAMGAIFFKDINAAVKVWWDYPAYSHCFLIIPISAWLIWERRHSLSSDRPACSPVALLGALPCLLLWFIGEFASITEFRQFSIIGLTEVFLVAILGWHIFRKISFACLYLFFLVPTGQYLIPPLQEITAKFVDVGLSFFGIPYFRDGLVFELVNGRYEIAEACAGLRFLVATVALGVLFAHLVYRKKAKIILFLAACCVVPIIGNGIRALATVMVANYTNNKVAAGFDHIVYGWMFAVAIIFFLLFVGSIFRDPDAYIEVDDRPVTAKRPGYLALAGTLAGALIIMSIAPALANFLGHKPPPIDRVALGRLTAIPGWHTQSVAGDWQIEFNPGDGQLATSVSPNGAASAGSIDVDVHYYVRDRGSASLLAERNHSWQDIWHPIERLSVHQAINGLNIPFDETIISAGDLRRLVWTTYWIDGRFTTSRLMIRLLEFQSGISRGHSAVVAFSTPITTSSQDARQRLGILVASLLAIYPPASAAWVHPQPQTGKRLPMCGISGWFDTRANRPPDAALLKRMNDVLGHRGPDGDGFFLAPGIGLGHRRLAIIDLSTGDQPMASRDGHIQIVFNGEIYNFRELRQRPPPLETKGRMFRTRSDTEVIIQAWEEWGPDAISRLRGMFAFALWDGRAQTLFLVRDRLGEKPLYYSQLDDGELIFGSELKALLVHPRCRREIDPQSVEDFFALGYVAEPRSIYTSIRKVSAGSFIAFGRGASGRQASYWSPAPKDSTGTLDERANELMARLTDSVKSANDL